MKFPSNFFSYYHRRCLELHSQLLVYYRPSLLSYSMPYRMVEGQRWSGAYVYHIHSLLTLIFIILKWVVASIFILCVGMSMAELASAAPTSGGVRATLTPVAH